MRTSVIFLIFSLIIGSWPTSVVADVFFLRKIGDTFITRVVHDGTSSPRLNYSSDAEKVTTKEWKLVRDYINHCFNINLLPGLSPKKPGWIAEECASALSPAHDGTMLNKKHILEVWENLGGPEATSGKVREHKVKGKRQWWWLGEEKLTELAKTFFSLVKAEK